MENASKALIIVASVLLAVMLFSFMFYMFTHLGDIANNTESRLGRNEIEAFNAQFSDYMTLDSTGESFLDKNTGRMQNISYRNLFETESVMSRTYYTQALVFASQNLRKVTDVVTAANLAININNKNNNDYKYNYLEVPSSVEIIVDLGNHKNNFKFNEGKGYQYLLIEPNKNVKANTIYGLTGSGESNKITTNRATNYENKYINATEKFKPANAVSLYDVLAEMRESKVINYENRSYTIYRYYFTASYEVNQNTELIETVKFTLLEDKNFYK